MINLMAEQTLVGVIIVFIYLHALEGDIFEVAEILNFEGMQVFAIVHLSSLGIFVLPPNQESIHICNVREACGTVKDLITQAALRVPTWCGRLFSSRLGTARSAYAIREYNLKIILPILSIDVDFFGSLV